MTLSEIKAFVREFTGRPDEGQISSAVITAKINQFLTNTLVLDLVVSSFETTGTFDTVAGTGEYALPVTVQNALGPWEIEDADGNVAVLDFWRGLDLFFELFPTDANNESDERNQPIGVCVYGRTVYLRPVPDDVYTIRYICRSSTPSLLVDDSDEPMDPQWGMALAYGTAALILDGGDEDDSAAKNMAKYEEELRKLKIKDLQQDVGRFSYPAW